MKSIEVVEVRREPPVFKTEKNSIVVCPVCWPRGLIFLHFPDLLRLRVPFLKIQCLVCESRNRTENR